MSKHESRLPDAAERARALDPTGSFIVQAPAGSGKTELLIQRYLALLAVVNAPEEILAITFTRKAATEMRTRILNALAQARAGEEPTEAHLLTGFRLAKAALERDGARDWGLNDQPSRMQIGTIDSINSRLARRAPLSAGLTSMHELVENPEPLFREAARETIELAGDDDELGTMIRGLLNYFDNRADRLEKLLADMLAQRDQWLRVTGVGVAQDSQRLRVELEASLADLVESSLAAADALIPESVRQSIFDVLSYAGCSISIEQPDSPLVQWQDADHFPDADVAAMALWRSMANAFLTKEKGHWRKALNKNGGFPPDGKNMKARALELIGTLGEVAGLEQALDEVGRLPDPVYTDEQWGTLEALLQALPLSVANLKQLFSTRGQTDYSECAQEALAALGSEDEPSELGLALDYRVSHILLDEFQDTSRSQFELLVRITAGWQPDSGRTLFLVGDPMQSIYRFRQAEVGLFISAKEHGVGEIVPDFLQLQTNFRSDPVIVDWFNDVFANTMPHEEDPVSGAIGFAPSVAFNAPDPDAGVSWHAMPFHDDKAEAGRILAIVEDALARWPTDSIGILVRSRSRAAAVARALRAARVEFSGTGFEKMEEQAIVQDLLALTRAMTHPADRLAWLAVLRGPWCGLSLADLAVIAADDQNACIFDVIRCAAPDTLSADGWARLLKLRAVLQRNLAHMRAAPLRDSIEQTWLELGGPAALQEASELDVADRFFEFLDSVDAGGDCADNGALLTHLQAVSMGDATGDGRVQIMTMHKAKGLEFDTVILPGLGYTTRKSDRPILLWQEFPRADQSDALAVAPMNAPGDDSAGVYDLLWRAQQRMESLELDRLLYVSVTRARKRLHLFAPLSRKKDSDTPADPAAGSLLARIWSVVGGQVEVEAGVVLQVNERKNPWQKTGDWFEVALRRMPADWLLPKPPGPCPDLVRAVPVTEPEELEYKWASPWAKHVGTVTHDWLQRIAEEGSEHYDGDRIAGLREDFRRMLRRYGTETENLDRAVQRVADALTAALEDERGRWILSGRHREAASEFPVSAVEGTDFAHLVIDRTFVCENGDRWIIDYKTSSHEGGQIDEFLRIETERYEGQLKRYRDAMARMEDRPTRTALYFPLLKILHEVQIDE